MGKFGFGQTNSLFMDGDAFPNTVDFWGPNALPGFRNVQIRYTPIKNEHQHLAIALERPGATADQGQYGEDFEYSYLLDGIAFRFPMPDLSAEYRRSGKWGYVELAGIIRAIKWEDENKGLYDFSGSLTGWGLCLSSNIKLGNKLTFIGAITTGAGVQNYMNDANADVGIKRQYQNTKTPITGEAIQMLGLVTYLDIKWNDKFSTTLGYSRLQDDPKETQLSTAFHTGQYATGNLWYYPAKNFMIGAELQYGYRKNNDFTGDTVFNLPAEQGNIGSDIKLQLSFKFNFNHTFFKTKSEP